MTPAALRRWRDRMGYSQAKAAESLGVSLRTYTRWEVDGQAIPRPVVKLIEVLSRGARET